VDSGSLVFSVVPGVGYLVAKSLDGKQSGTLNGKTTAKKSSRKESKTESLTTPQYSAMCEHSPVKGTPENIEEWLMMSEHHTTENDCGFWATPTRSVAHPEMHPTPRANDAEKRGAINPNESRNGLPSAVRKYPTPSAQDAKNSTLPPSQIDRDSIPGALLKDGVSPGGQLNPNWVEWLMGFPIGQTDLKPLEMGKFHSQWLQPMQSYLRSLLMDEQL
jgi:hypothetical protein